MNGAELRVLAAQQGFDVGTLEKDYALTVLLKAIYAEGGTPVVAFKGGTALQKIYLGHRRISEDLDFTALEPEDGTTGDIILSRLSAYEFPRDFRTEVLKARYGGLRVKYLGPLEHPNSVRIEVSHRERPFRRPVWTNVPHFYEDEIGPFDALCLDLEEMVAEKIRAAMSPGREKPRDILDLFLIEESFPGMLAKTLPDARSKCEGISQEFGLALIERKKAVLGALWDSDLRRLARGGKYPDFETAYHTVMTAFKNKRR
jgi:predicted nucleotidyltransferase component of viral defense system